MFGGVGRGIALSNRVSTFYHFDIYIMTFSVWYLNQSIYMCPEDVYNYQNMVCSTNTFVTNSPNNCLSWLSFFSRSSKHHEPKPLEL